MDCCVNIDEGLFFGKLNWIIKMETVLLGI